MRSYFDIQWALFRLVFLVAGGVLMWMYWRNYVLYALAVVVGVVLLWVLYRMISYAVSWSLSRCGVWRWGEVMSLGNRDFEYFVAELFRLRGFDASVTQASRDHGHDLVLRKQRKVYLCEVKHYADTKIGEAKIRDFAGALSLAGVSRGAYVTSSLFTKSAYEAAGDLDIELIDQRELKKWIGKLSRKGFVSLIRGV